MRRILMTGAGGRLGTLLRPALRGMARTLRLSDRTDLGSPGEGEEIVRCDLADPDAVMALVDGCDGIVHLGGIPRESSFEAILDANIRGTYHIFEAARRHGRPRVLFASSNHVVGFHDRTTRLDRDAPLRPDSLYGVSKCFGEALASYYFDKHGVENVCVRIGSCAPEPRDRRGLATWLSPGDLASLVRRTFQAPHVDHTVVYGVSDNAETWWDNSHAAFLGWRPRNSSEPFRDRVEAATPDPDPNDPAVRFQGGSLAAQGRFEGR